MEVLEPISDNDRGFLLCSLIQIRTAGIHRLRVDTGTEDVENEAAPRWLMRFLACLLSLFIIGSFQALGEGLELRDLETTGWPCLNQPTGIAKTQDGIERNAMKNRALDQIPAMIESLGTLGFLRKVAIYDAELKAQRRNPVNRCSEERPSTLRESNRVSDRLSRFGIPRPAGNVQLR